MRGGVQMVGEAAAVDGEINLGSIGRALWRRKRSIIGPTLIMAVAAYLAVIQITPRYRSEARVLVEGRENIFLRPEAEKALMDRGTADQETVTSQVQLVLSRDLARIVFRELDLEGKPEFNAGSMDFSPMALLRHIGIGRDPQSMTLEERVLSAYFDRLRAYAIDKSRVIAIEFQSADPELAARAANVIAENYLTLQQVAKQDQARAAGQWLSGELEKLRIKVSEAEAKVEQFRAKSNLFVGSGSTSLANQQLTELSTQVSAARAQKADAEAKARLLRDAMRTGQTIEASEVVNSELIRRLSEQRVTLRAQLAEQSSTLLPQHPRIRELRAQIVDLDQQIRSEGERMARSLENDAKIAAARLDSLTASLDQLKSQSASTSDQDVQLRALEREAKAQRDLFESYLAKYREASARDSIAAAPADARIISRAVISSVPYFPKKAPIVVIAALATFCLSSAFVVTSALLSGETYRPAPLQIDRTQPAQAPARAPKQAPAKAPPADAPNVERRAPRSRQARTRSTDKLPAAPNIPAPQAAKAAGATASPAQSIDDLAAALQQEGEGGRRIAVIGAARDIGTTLTAIALGRALSRDARVVLVDLALASPNIDVISNDPQAPGITDLIRGTASFGDIITRDQFSRLQLVAAGAVGDDHDGIWSSHMLPAALGALAQSYDYLVIDAGAQSNVALDPIVTIASRAVLVGGDTPAKALDALAGQMTSAGFEVTVLTGPPPTLEQGAARSAAA